jgi:hypothetical protein
MLIESLVVKYVRNVSFVSKNTFFLSNSIGVKGIKIVLSVNFIHAIVGEASVFTVMRSV